MEGIGSRINDVVTKGVDVALAFIRGIADNAVRFAKAAADVLIDFLNGMAEAIRDKAPQIREAGKNIAGAIIEGITGGLGSGKGGVINSAVGIATGAISAVTGALGIKSPSKVFMKIAANAALGMAQGFDKDTVAKNSAVEHAERIINAFQESLSQVPDSLMGMGEFNPVITPVLDLTNVQAESRNLNRLMSVSAITPDVSYDRARLISTTTDLEPTASDEPAYAGSCGG